MPTRKRPAAAAAFTSALALSQGVRHVGALRAERGEVAFDGDGGVIGYVVLQEAPPVFTIGFVLT